MLEGFGALAPNDEFLSPSRAIPNSRIVPIAAAFCFDRHLLATRQNDLIVLALSRSCEFPRRDRATGTHMRQHCFGELSLCANIGSKRSSKRFDSHSEKRLPFAWLYLRCRQNLWVGVPKLYENFFCGS
jgi:hypothetical protein